MTKIVSEDNAFVKYEKNNMLILLISTQMLYFGDVDAIFWVMMQENYFRITDMKSAGISYFF